MKAQQLLDYFSRHNVHIAVDGEKLRIKAPKGFLSSELAAALKLEKVALIELLTRQREEECNAGTPLSPSQRHLWFLHQLDPETPSYNNPIAIKITGPLNVKELHRAVNAVVARHDMLRARFTSRNGVPSQTFPLAVELDLDLINLSSLAQEHQEIALAGAIQADARMPFDLDTEPMVRTSYVKLSDAEHVWLVNLHHIAADGWSIGLFFNEVTAHYNGLRTGTQPDVPALIMQYADYVTHTQKTHGSSEEPRQTAYWIKQLQGLPDALDLPTDFLRPAQQTHNGAHYELELDEDLSARLRQFCTQRSITPFALFLAGFSVILWRYSQQENICIGTSFANRHLAEVEPLIGHFINTLALKANVSASMKFEDLVTQAQTTILEALDNQEIPFERVVEAVNPERSATHSPLFQVMLIYQNVPGSTLQMEEVETSALTTDSQTAKFDITLEVFERGQIFSFGFEYNRDLFTQRRIQRLADHLSCFLSDAVTRPATPVSELNYITPEETHLLTEVWPKGETQPFDAETIEDAIEAQCLRTPDALAVVFGERVMNYATLNAQANQLAQHLQTLGVGTGSPVGLLFERSIELVVAMLAILKVGGHFVPLEPGLPIKRLEYMVEDSQPVLIVYHDATSGILTRLDEACGIHSLLLNGDQLKVIADTYDPVNLPAKPHNADSLAYIIYTSGSTGVPKGTKLTHRGLVNLTEWSCRTFPFSTGDVLLQKTPMGFDAAVWEFFWPLTTGASLALAPPESHTSPSELVRLCAAHNITAIQFVPAMLDLFLDVPELAACPQLRDVFCGGGELGGPLLRKFANKMPWARLHNVYGPTECTVDSTWHAITPDDLDSLSAPIGKPISNTSAYLLDEYGAPVPVGVLGEIYIGGSGLSSGYLNAPQLTTEAFTQSPFEEDEQLYRTGDLARYTENGDLIFAVRKDNQVKLNGFRIELSEIDAVFSQVSQCQNCAALVVHREDTPAHLALCYTNVHGEPLPEESLKSDLGQALPAYMVPNQLLHIDSIPLTNNGKVDYQALEALLLDTDAVFKVNQESPRDHIELQIYNIWKKVLLHPSIGISDNFFHVGGSSIAAIKVAHRVGKLFKVSVPPKVFIANPTIEALATWIRTGAADDSDLDNLITFRESRSGKQIVCIHPAGGTGFCYLSLAKVLADDIGIYGLQSPGLNAGEDLLPSITVMAEAYLSRIEHIADDQIVLTGLSFGGYVAFEMARLLKARGNNNVSVILLDTQGFEEHERESLAPVGLQEFRDKLVKFNGMYPGIEDGQIQRYYEVYNHNRSCVPSYDCQPLEARVVFIQALGTLDKTYLHELRKFWIERVSGSFMTRLVRGDHWELLESSEIQRVTKAIYHEFHLFELQATTPAGVVASGVRKTVSA
ncbi:non-ribosomal peptide synthetase [Pseudovibrio sp. Tun.PSC04-5.I4]|uniref:non-ribosomal peptide synthetase n=1 Tax=Pseudovibrio sp. Tun.PSC04-5.I4 TaxID=1798213 RepID=UPI00088BCF98|nr:non-ribosomal peptide synthetase [Pseudovibrio sp. Tun.PSC04-5.I4]SDQ31239.1 amino acid adenylation domain-containing protein [Pseudovibrio sp. Tun.PSC04-5.I4]